MATRQDKRTPNVFQPVSIPNEGRQEQVHRPTISGFGANVETGRMTRYGADGSQETTYATPAQQMAAQYGGQPINPAQQMFAQYGQLINQGKAARAQKQRQNAASLASMLIYSRENGGFLPPDMLEAVSAQHGVPIAGGNFTGDGNYILYGRGKTANGSDQIMPIAVVPQEMQFRALQQSGLGATMQQELYNGFARKLTPQQLAERGIIDPSLAIAKNAKDGWLNQGKGAGAKFDKERYAAMQNRLDSLKYDVEYDPEGNVMSRTPREMSDEDKALAQRLMSGMDAMLGLEEPQPAGGGEAMGEVAARPAPTAYASANDPGVFWQSGEKAGQRITDEERAEAARILEERRKAAQGDKIPKFDPKRQDYRAGDKFERNGVIYEVGTDGQPHKVK